MAAIEARLQRLEDLAEIHQLFIDYGVYLDAGDFDRYAELFATDGEVKLGPMGKAQGRDAIKALMSKALAGATGNSFHIISSPVVQLDGDRATSRVMWSVIERTQDGNAKLTIVGSHHDELVREDGRWRIKLRRGMIDIPGVYRGPGA
jgi:uncharacterized protein (TIGR02246 family)